MNALGSPGTLREHFAQQAQVHPLAPALLAPGHATINYAKLFALTRCMRTWLAARGLGPASRIALLMPSGLSLAVAMLGVGCQATAIPLNPALTELELLALLADARADAILSAPHDPTAVRLARHLGVTHLAFDLESMLSASLGAPPESDGNWITVDPDATAFVLFTSGTTGQPKRVPLKHRQLLCSGRNIAQHLALTPADRGLCVMPLFHSHGLIGGLLSPLVAGSSVVCGAAFDADRFVQSVAQFNPTWYTAAPTIHHAVTELAPAYRAAVPDHRFRFIRSASSALSAEILNRLEALYDAPVIDTYGMTESATQMASNPLPPGVRKPGSPGRPAGADLRVVDDQGRTLPPNCIGQIVARGPALFDGYEDAPAANQEAFSDGWFATGDLGRLDADGYLYLTGRRSELINRGGEKIAPFEIEQALLRQAGVVQAVAYPAPHPTLGEDVHATVVLASGSAAEPQDLRAALFGVIADFKIPACIHVVRKIPVGAGGKIQRRVLHDQMTGLVEAQPAAVLLAGLQVEVAGLFADILNQPVAGPDANFLALGGDSLSATRVVLAVNHVFGVDLPPSALLVEPTVRGFAVALQCAIDEADALSDAWGSELDALSDTEIARLLASG